MKVVCIDNSKGAYRNYEYKWNSLTVGKIYSVTKTITNALDVCYLIIDDDGDDLYYFSRHFKPLEEVRQEKLDQIL